MGIILKIIDDSQDQSKPASHLFSSLAEEFKTYESYGKLIDSYNDLITFSWKGENKTKEIYQTITTTFLHPSNLYIFSDVLIKMSLAALFKELHSFFKYFHTTQDMFTSYTIARIIY